MWFDYNIVTLAIETETDFLPGLQVILLGSFFCEILDVDHCVPWATILVS